MLVPLYGFLEGDTLGLLILADSDDTIDTVATRLGTMARLRVDPAGTWEVRTGDGLLDGDLTVEQAQLSPLDRVDVRRCR